MTTYTGQQGSVNDDTNAIAEVKSFTVTQTADVVEDTVMGDTWKTNKATLNSWTASVTALADHTDTTGQGAFTVGATVTFKGYPSNSTSGNLEISGSAIVTSREYATSHDGMVEFTLELTGSGALAEASVV